MKRLLGCLIPLAVVLVVVGTPTLIVVAGLNALSNMVPGWGPPEVVPQGGNPGGSPPVYIYPFPSAPGEESPEDFAVISPEGERAMPIWPDNYPELLKNWTGSRSQCGIPFGISAGVAATESSFGRNRNTSSAGAQGDYQFLPSTWYNPDTHTGWGINPATGRPGNILDVRDSGPAADRYLCYLQHTYGRDRNNNPLTWAQAIRRAIFYYGGSHLRSYDPNDDEVVLVMGYARRYSMPQQAVVIPNNGKVGGWDWEVKFAFLGRYTNPFNPRIPYHRGVDLAIAGAPDNGYGRPVKAFYPGVVSSITHDPAGGNGIIIWVPNLGVYHRYFHWDRIDVRRDQVVTTDTVLGVLGATGTNDPWFPHVHFEVSLGIDGDDLVEGRPNRGLINPMPFVYAQVPIPAQQMARSPGGN